MEIAPARRSGLRLLVAAGAAASVHAGLLLYGGVVAGVAVTVLTGVVDPGGPIDRRAMIGHAVLWYPLFALWGPCC